MSCPELLRTQAYLDGELDEKASLEAERHLQSCVECKTFSTDAAQLSDALRRASRYRRPENIHGVVRAALDNEDRKRNVFASAAKRRSFWLGTAGGAGLSALAASLIVGLILPPSATTLAQSVTDAHVQALMSGKIIEVVSSNHHTVKPWFAGRVPVSPPVEDFAGKGFALTGGRVDEVAHSRAAVVVYRHGNHEIDLFVWADRGSQLPGESMRHGYHSVFWKNGDLDFAAVCDMEGPELRKFVDLVRSEQG